MTELVFKGQFKKDLKRYKHDRRSQEAIHAVLSLLRDEQPLPVKCHEHLLSGTYAGCWECHCLPDVLLIYQRTDAGVVLLRAGSHGELF